MRSSTIAAVLASAACVAANTPQAWNNSSPVADITVTDYVTYCPASTVVTVTTCTEDKCAPTTITVTEATTLTVTGKCIVPASNVSPTEPAAPLPTGGAHNGTAPEASTITTDITVTDYTTFCPASTVVTITTCNDACAPHIVTVTEPTTLTVTGKCIVPTTIVESAPASSASAPAALTSPAPAAAPAESSAAAPAESSAAPARSSAPASSAAPSVTAAANAGNSLNVAGVAGLVGAAALML